MEPTSSVRSLLSTVRGLPESKVTELVDYLQREAYADVGCLLQAWKDPAEWAAIKMPLHVKHVLGRHLGRIRQHMGAPGPLGLPSASTAVACSFLSTSQVARLAECCGNFKALVQGPDFAALWRSFLTEAGLLSAGEDARRKYVQLATVDLQGAWLDIGRDDTEEEYRCMTTMRELPRRSPICRCFEAISYLGPFETKVSYSMVSGAIFVSYERFVDPGTGVISGPLNIASGVLDLSPSPRVFGTWVQYSSRMDLGRGPHATRRRDGELWGPSPPMVQGSFDFVQIALDEDPSPKRRRLR
ncbi:unnamed protein product [Effrenium voratum]|uniref:F-box domain-containing protein n=1 Tax=Effrenium voratum TaxID=2562239 RepID=A0AA36IAQ3_9DINO|nr:unnamed protein product [Effrenium voratum]